MYYSLSERNQYFLSPFEGCCHEGHFHPHQQHSVGGGDDNERGEGVSSASDRCGATVRNLQRRPHTTASEERPSSQMLSASGYSHHHPYYAHHTASDIQFLQNRHHQEFARHRNLPGRTTKFFFSTHHRKGESITQHSIHLGEHIPFAFL